MSKGVIAGICFFIFIIVIVTIVVLSAKRHNKKESIIFIKRDEKAILPVIGSYYSSGYDLSSMEEIIIQSGETKKIPTGITVVFPKDIWGKIETRSSVALKGLFTQGGVIDNDYTGEISIILYNSSKFERKINGRIAQLVLHKMVVPDSNAKIKQGVRGTRGFGSS